MGKELELPEEFDPDEPGREAVSRYYQDQGKRLEILRLSIVNLTKHQFYVTSLNIRWPLKDGDSHLVVLKALTDESPKISFSSGYNMADAMFSLGGRMRSGQHTWQDDTFPVDGWEKQLKWVRKNRHTVE